jgi:hypothetical protein
MDSIEDLLLHLPRLKHLELHVGNAPTGLADGQRWENLTDSLITFNFNFHVALVEIEETLATFRTPYWLEKCWFVAYEANRLFSVPYFARNHCNDTFQPPIHSTVLDDCIYLNNINYFEISQTSVDIARHFPHVHTLRLNNGVAIETLTTIIDINRIEHLILCLPIFQSLPNAFQLLCLPRLCRLSIMSSPFPLVQQLRGNRFEQIRSLEMNSAMIFDDNFSVEQLCSIFPRVERLHVQAITTATMIRMIDGFKCLSNASFAFPSLPAITRDYWLVKPEWAIYGTQRLTKNTYSCGYDGSYLHVWISEQVSQLR